jgi:predicted esterase
VSEGTSSLIRLHIAGAAREPTVLAIHDDGADLEQLTALVSAIEFHRFVGAQAMRAKAAPTQGLCDPKRYSWYLIQEIGRPEPATFGESLVQLELLLGELAMEADEGARFLLVGLGQGAVLALTLALLHPERMLGVAALAGWLPEIDGWSPPHRPLAGLPCLIVDDPAGPAPELLARTCAELERRGASVERSALAGVAAAPSAAGGLFSSWWRAINDPAQPRGTSR